MTSHPQSSSRTRPDRTASAWPLLALLPMALAVLGAALDEHWRRGFTLWRSACRASGLSASSLIGFTLELLPLAVLGALLGGLAVQTCGICLRKQRGRSRASLAAHAGCALGMVVGLPLCALALPLPGVLAAEALLAVTVAAFLQRLPSPFAVRAASGVVLTRRLPSA